MWSPRVSQGSCFAAVVAGRPARPGRRRSSLGLPRNAARAQSRPQTSLRPLCAATRDLQPESTPCTAHDVPGAVKQTPLRTDSKGNRSRRRTATLAGVEQRRQPNGPPSSIQASLVVILERDATGRGKGIVPAAGPHNVKLRCEAREVLRVARCRWVRRRRLPAQLPPRQRAHRDDGEQQPHPRSAQHSATRTAPARALPRHTGASRAAAAAWQAGLGSAATGRSSSSSTPPAGRAQQQQPPAAQRRIASQVTWPAGVRRK
jgi:hypothetical protein